MKYICNSYLLAAIMLSATQGMYAAIPSGYYDKCEGKSGKELLYALHETISSHTTVSYDGLWDLYKSSDVDENGKIWDMYSTKRWNGGEKCGSYKKVGDCYNREHSFPKSWFNDASPMVSDAFHIYPTDGKVNGQRSNFPFGECANGETLPSSGSVKALGRLGYSTFPGYSGKVFEPDDQYKGDFARSYFYMAACYNDRISGWSSDMLSGNSYPVFKDWAKNLLLKWTRSDLVSKKETDRQEAVYGRQRNRNPFIDHPELAEYIWGDKVGTPWYSDASSVSGELELPAAGSTIDLGYAATGVRRSVTVRVKARNASSPVTITVAGSGYAVSPASLTAAQANAGYDITVSINSAGAGVKNGSLTIASGSDFSRVVPLTANVQSGLPIYDATNISSESFQVHWVYLNDASSYTLHVLEQGKEIAGYPRQVTGSAEKAEVTGLEPTTRYEFYLTSGSLTSEHKYVTTSALAPSIDVYYDGELAFQTIVGTPSEIAELLVRTENVEGDISVAVRAPFQVSIDKTNWSTSVVLDPEEDRFYMRVYGDTPGNYTTSIKLTAGDYTADDAIATAVILKEAGSPDMIETFDVDESVQASYGPYKNNVTFQGTAFLWTLHNAGISGQSQDLALNGSYVIRFGNESDSALEMAEDKPNGIGTVTFEYAKWNGDPDPVIDVEYSDDGGTSWTHVGSFTTSAVPSDGAKEVTHSVQVNRPGNVRLRFVQTEGKRLIIDNVAMPSYSFSGIESTAEYHQWDAFCRNGHLVIEAGVQGLNIAAYGMDGMTWYSDSPAVGQTEIRLPAGLYVVACNGFTRRVLIK